MRQVSCKCDSSFHVTHDADGSGYNCAELASACSSRSSLLTVAHHDCAGLRASPPALGGTGGQDGQDTGHRRHEGGPTGRSSSAYSGLYPAPGGRDRPAGRHHGSIPRRCGEQDRGALPPPASRQASVFPAVPPTVLACQDSRATGAVSIRRPESR